MAKRNCPTLQKSLDWCEGMPSHPGIRRRVYFCNKSLIVAYPTLPRDEFGRPTAAVLEGNFELADGAYWQYLDINIDKSTVTSEPQGEVPSQTQLNKATLVHNGIDEEATAAAGWLNNSDNVYIVEDMPGKFRVLGNNKWRTLTTVNQDMGQGTNPASTTINVKVTDEVAAPFYFGSIETEDGTVTPDADATPRVLTPSRIDVEIGGTYPISYMPKDGNWSFVTPTVRPQKIEISSDGVISGLAQGTAEIACNYNGETIATITADVDYKAGEDPGDGGDPESPDPGTETQSPITPTDVMLNVEESKNLSFEAGPEDKDPAAGWFFVVEDDRIATVNPSYEQVGLMQKTIIDIEGESAGETVIHAVKDNTLVNINVVVVDGDPEAIGPGSTIDVPVIGTGWTAESEDDSIAAVTFDEENSKFVITAGEGEGETDVNFTNESTGCEFSITITVDGEAAG